MKPSNNLENKAPLDTYWRVHLICKKVPAHSSLEPLLEYSQDQMPMTFLTIWEVTEILCSFKLVLEWETGKEIPESSRLEFLEKFAANNFAFSDAEDNTFGPLNRRDIADLPLLRTQKAKSHESQVSWK